MNGFLLDSLKTEAYLSNVHSTALASMFQGELDAHLGYLQNAKNIISIARNGATRKQIKAEFGKSKISIPRDRQGCFKPVVIAKHKSNSLSIQT